MTIKEKFNEINQKYIEALRLIQAITTEEIFLMFKEILEEHPDIVNISWIQYTPYFNDGEPCEWSCQEPELTVIIDNSEVEIDSWDIDKDKYKSFKPAYKKILEIYNLIPESVQKNILGNDVKVIISSGKLEIEDWNDHD